MPFSSPTEAINDAAIPVTKQAIFEAALNGIKLDERSEPAMKNHLPR
jgi:conjugal transfer pilus assembly protein TraK